MTSVGGGLYGLFRSGVSDGWLVFVLLALLVLGILACREQPSQGRGK